MSFPLTAGMILREAYLTYTLAGLSPQGVRWKVHHDVLKSNGKKSVSLDVEGVLLDLATRQPVAPPAELLQTFSLIPWAADFEVLPELRRMR